MGDTSSSTDVFSWQMTTNVLMGKKEALNLVFAMTQQIVAGRRLAIALAVPHSATLGLPLSVGY